MKRISAILPMLLLAGASFAQGVTNFGATRAQDTGKTAGTVQFTKYAAATGDTNLLMTNSAGKIVTVSKSGIVVTQDTGRYLVTKTELKDSLSDKLSGLGSVGYIPVYNRPDNLGNSLLFQNGNELIVDAADLNLQNFPGDSTKALFTDANGYLFLKEIASGAATLQEVTDNDSVTTRQVTTSYHTVTPIFDTSGTGTNQVVGGGGYKLAASQLNPKADDFKIIMKDFPNYSGTGNNDMRLMIGYNMANSGSATTRENTAKAMAKLDFEQSYYIGGSMQDTASEFHYDFVSKAGQVVRPFAIYNAQNEDYRLNHASIAEISTTTGFINSPTWGTCFGWDSTRGPVIGTINPVGDYDILLRENGGALAGGVRHLSALPVSKVSGAHSGSISANRIPKSTGSTAFTNSSIIDDGTTVTTALPLIANAGVATAAFENAFGSAIRLSRTSGAPYYVFDRYGPGANGNLVAALGATGTNSASAQPTFAGIYMYSTIITAGSERGKMDFSTMHGGGLNVGASLKSDTMNLEKTIVNDGVVANGGGLKHRRVSTGSISAASSALVTITWPTAFADGNYTVTVDVVDTTTSNLALSVVHIESITASAITVRVYNNSAGPLTGTLHAIAMHD